MEDDHSILSFNLTKNILIRLMEGKPLTPIEDIPENWNQEVIRKEDDGTVVYQCKRMSSLFKTVHPDGSASYSDVDRYYCVNMDAPKTTYQGGGAGQIVDEYFPIVMPYDPPTGQYKVYTQEYLTDRVNGDYDTKEFCYIIDPFGHKVQIRRYFGEVDDQWQELSAEEFNKRLQQHNARMLSEAASESDSQTKQGL